MAERTGGVVSVGDRIRVTDGRWRGEAGTVRGFRYGGWDEGARPIVALDCLDGQVDSERVFRKAEVEAEVER